MAEKSRCISKEKGLSLESPFLMRMFILFCQGMPV